MGRAESLPHADFLSLLLSDEVDRRDRCSAELRARAARLDPRMRLDTFNTDSAASLDRQTWNALAAANEPEREVSAEGFAGLDVEARLSEGSEAKRDGSPGGALPWPTVSRTSSGLAFDEVVHAGDGER